MKKFLLPVLFCIAFFGVSNAQTIPYPGTPSTVIRLDSVYEYDWQDNNWVVKTKNYKIRGSNELITEDLYKKIHPLTHQWSNYMRYLYDYNDTDTVAVTGQNWTLAEDWVTFKYTHYTGGLPDEDYLKEWDQIKQMFTSGTRNFFEYNQGGKVITQTSQMYDENISDWVYSVKYNNTYNTADLKTEEVFQIFNDTGWINNYRKVYTYNSENKVTNEQEYTWIDTSSSWLAVNRSAYTYNFFGVEHAVIENWNNFSMTWDSVQQTRYYYNFDYGWLLSENTMNYDINSETWIPYSFTSHSYFPDGTERTYYIDMYDPLTSVYITTLMNRYDSVHNLAEHFEKFLDFTTYTVLAGTYESNTYNSHRDIIEKLVRSWDVNASDWINQSKATFTYDQDNMLTEKLVQSWNPEWGNMNRTLYFYTRVNGIGEIYQNNFCSFNNPLKAGSDLYCSNPDNGKNYFLSAISLTGRNVWNTTMTGGDHVTVPAGIPAGMYILKLELNGKTVCSQKVIITR